MRFSVLGPMEVRSAEDAELELGGPKQRAVLALLVVSANHVVDTDRLVDELWPEGQARTSRKTAQAYVARLRRVFADHGAEDALRALAGGYVLEAEPDAVDACRFERDVGRARALVGSDPSTAASLVQDCLELWRGRPFEDAHPTEELEGEARRLEELRLSAIETGIEADLALGRHGDVVAELESLVRAHPLRERLWALLMVALYRCGRQADALGWCRELRGILDDQLGVEPGREIRELERQILNHDPALDLPRVPPPVAAEQTHRSPRRAIAAALAVAALGAALAAVIVLARGGGEDGLEVVARYPVPPGATEVAATASAVWVLDPEGSTLVTVDPTTGRTSSVPLTDPPSTLAAGHGFVWVASEEGSSLTKLDASSGRVLARIDRLDLRGASLAVSARDLWIIRETARPFVRVDEESLTVEVLDLDLGVPVAPDITVAGDRLWGSNGQIGQVLSLDPKTGSSELHGEPLLGQHGTLSITYDRGAIWFSQPTHGSVTRLDADTGTVVATVSIGESRTPQFVRGVAPYELAGGPGGLWLTQPERGKVLLLDERTGAVRTEISLDRPVGLAAAAGSMWVLDRGASELVRIDGPPCSEAPFVGPGADLRACDLARSVFVGVDLSGADLRWADLRSSALQRADFTDADLLGANLQGSALDDITWQNTRCPDGTLSDLHRATCALNLTP
ncbi:MAG: BTAD domain-containing putative transcriptional regulator [Gaiellaceae bacterium]